MSLSEFIRTMSTSVFLATALGLSSCAHVEDQPPVVESHMTEGAPAEMVRALRLPAPSYQFRAKIPSVAPQYALAQMVWMDFGRTLIFIISGAVLIAALLYKGVSMIFGRRRKITQTA